MYNYDIITVKSDVYVYHELLKFYKMHMVIWRVRSICLQSLLMKIRELLLTLTEKELSTLERMLCSSDEVKFDEKLTSTKNQQQLS